VEERIRAVVLRKVKGGGGNRREENEKKGKKRDLPDQCQTASYAPDLTLVESTCLASRPLNKLQCSNK